MLQLKEYTIGVLIIVLSLMVFRKADLKRTCLRFLEARRKEQGIENPDMSDVMDGAQRKARDHARLPVQVSRIFISRI